MTHVKYILSNEKIQGALEIFFLWGPSVAAPGLANDLIICHNLSHSPLH